MSTQQIADRFVAMCREGNFSRAMKEFYADEIISKEMPGMPNEVTSGIKDVVAKSEAWMNNVQEFHKAEVSEPQVAGNHFSCTMDMDVTFKDRGRQQMSEVCVYQLNDQGKICNEQFFYSF